MYTFTIPICPFLILRRKIVKKSNIVVYHGQKPYNQYPSSVVKERASKFETKHEPSNHS